MRNPFRTDRDVGPIKIGTFFTILVYTITQVLAAITSNLCREQKLERNLGLTTVANYMMTVSCANAATTNEQMKIIKIKIKYMYLQRDASHVLLVQPPLT